MKLQVWKPTTPEPPEEPVLRLALKLDGGDVILHVVDEDGDHVIGGNILAITADGALRRIRLVNRKLGLQLGEMDRIIIDEVREFRPWIQTESQGHPQ